MAVDVYAGIAFVGSLRPRQAFEGRCIAGHQDRDHEGCR